MFGQELETCSNLDLGVSEDTQLSDRPLWPTCCELVTTNCGGVPDEESALLCVRDDVTEPLSHYHLTSAWALPSSSMGNVAPSNQNSFSAVVGSSIQCAWHDGKPVLTGLRLQRERGEGLWDVQGQAGSSADPLRWPKATLFRWRARHCCRPHLVMRSRTEPADQSSPAQRK